jgi:hypothetical protein
MNNIIWMVAALMFYSCQTVSKPSKDTTYTSMDASNNTLADRLENDHYGDFYNYTLQGQIIDQVWTEAGGVAPLKAIVLNEKASNKARLIANEILLKKEFTYLRAEDVSAKTVAQIYTTALAQNTTGMANSWGLLYEHDDMGPVGYFLGLLGEEALPALVELLDNETIHLYQGSEEATVGNDYQFQVRDFAAYYISQILNEPSPYQAERAERDREIERLRALAQNK